MKVIDVENWDRKEHFAFFRRMDYPHYNIGTDLDITAFKAAVKEAGYPFSFALTYAVSTVMNEVEAFRYRLRDGEVLLYDRVHPAFAYLAPNMKYFKMVTMDLTPEMGEFVEKARHKALTQDRYFVAEDIMHRGDLIYLSNSPGVSFTHLTHTISFNKDDAVPRLSWGKYYERDGRLWLPFNVQVNHAFVDGEHMGNYLNKMLDYFNQAGR